MSRKINQKKKCSVYWLPEPQCTCSCGHPVPQIRESVRFIMSMKQLFHQAVFQMGFFTIIVVVIERSDFSVNVKMN